MRKKPIPPPSLKESKVEGSEGGVTSKQRHIVETIANQANDDNDDHGDDDDHDDDDHNTSLSVYISGLSYGASEDDLRSSS